MEKENLKSLSSKIVFSIALASLFILLGFFTIFEKINKEAFYQIEGEKAEIIAKTIEPLIGMNIYLDMKENVEQITRQLLENPNILAIKILANNEIISEIKSNEYQNNLDDSFIVTKSILQPNSYKEVGRLTLTYSNKEYKELVGEFTDILLKLLLVLTLLFILFGIYIKRLLSPLRKISRSLKNYSPNKNIKFPYASQKNEIGLISNALNEMQEKICQYSKKQENINNYLEEQVNEKTKELSKQLYTDTLTGLPNRLSLINSLADIKDGALIVLNIDDFKEINDFYGHAAGDSILKKLSNRLINIFKENETVQLKYLSSDEFALLFTQKPQLKNFIQTIEKLIFAIEKMIFLYQENEINIRVTIGATYQIDRALEKADIALKSARKQQKSFFLYDKKLNIEKQYKNNMEWVKKLNKALEQDKIVPYFQPIFDNTTNKISSYECLIRLINSDNTPITPDIFLTIAKKSRLYKTLTKIMIEKSCQYFEHIDSNFSINLSVEDILNKEIVTYIKQKIKQYNVADKIIFEILESEGIENYEEISIFINDMKKLGCKIAIDDFGSGYSNFEHLLKLNIDYIKIDGTLIKNLDKDINAQMIVGIIVEFAKRLNIVTIAEYVHSKEVFEKAKELNIDRIQGFFIAKPQPTISSIKDNALSLIESDGQKSF
ncbi:MAG: diguanylate cyclase [Sulfurimonas sp.]|nr:MAG: diguanylate cyclase [Sulfurimonas sp.]